ncbi:MAG: ABC transporter substrate-binding protein, partial [Cyanobacteria bacterium P01_D01_bin.123]
RQRRRNDPETLIYLNNAKVGDRDAVYVAAAVPVADNPNSAQEILRGVAQVQQAHNDSGNGLPLKVIIADDANDKAQAQAVANALVDDKRVRLVVGHGTSTTSLAGAEIYQAAGLPMIAPTSTSTELAALTRTGTNFVYRTIPSDQFSGTILARYVLEDMGKKSAAVFFNSESAYSRSMKQAFETTFGLEGGLVSETIDFASENGVARLADASAEVVALFPNSSTFDRALEVARANNKRLPMVAGDAMYTVNALREAGESLEGMILPVPWHPVSSAEPNFVASSSQLWGGDVNWRTALSYDAMQTLTAAFSSAEQSREALAQTIGESNFSARGVTGDIRFLPTGDRSGSLVLVRVQPGDRSKTGYDFVPIQ